MPSEAELQRNYERLMRHWPNRPPGPPFDPAREQELARRLRKINEKMGITPEMWDQCHGKEKQ